MDKKRVLFICVHNAARSQIAEALLNTLAGDRFQAESAGLEPGTLNPLAITVMREIGIDISGNRTKSVFDLYKQGKLYDYVITVCSEADSGKCPIFPGNAIKLHWPFDDPAAFTGRWEGLKKTRQVRDRIKERIKQFISQGDSAG
jgi:arsenate reductase (thioredoxin)